nr:hypothetical protein [uncultured Desulfobacter sp.]
MKKILISLVFIFTVASYANAALSNSVANTSILVDWLSFQCVGYSTDENSAPSLSWSNYNEYSSGNLNPEHISDHAENWSDGTSVTTGDEGGQVTASTSLTDLYISTSSTALNVPNTPQYISYGDAIGILSREADISVSGYGVIEFSVGYQWTLDINDLADFSSADIYISMYVIRPNDNETGYKYDIFRDSFELYVNIENDGANSLSGSGTLSFSFEVEDGDEWTFRTFVSSATRGYNETAVPIPGSVWLLGTSLMLLFYLQASNGVGPRIRL